MRDVRRADRRRDARAARRGRADALHRPPRGRRAGAARADGLGRGETADNDRITLFVAFNYGGRAEILDAAARYTGGGEEAFRALLYAPEMHDPDLVIRTSGEQRLSNYLLWQSAYSELVFADELWPDFTREAFERGLDEYDARAAPVRGALSRVADLGGARSRVARVPADRLRDLHRRPGRLVVRRRARSLLGLVCLHELYAMFAQVRPARLAGFLALIGLVVAAILGDPTQVLLVAVAVSRSTFLLTVAGPRRGRRVRHRGRAARRVLDRPGDRPRDPAARAAARRRDLAAVLVGTFVGDTGAYFGGRALGAPALAPRISPNKTVEGLAFGIVAAILAVWIVGCTRTGSTRRTRCILGAAVALAAPLGDLFESFIKRDAGTKDTGRVFGAHGGALDRLDARALHARRRLLRLARAAADVAPARKSCVKPHEAPGNARSRARQGAPRIGPVACSTTAAHQLHGTCGVPDRGDRRVNAGTAGVGRDAWPSLAQVRGRRARLQSA